jgi:glycosyltransferase involved in cell wall biosynthesis
VPAYNASATIRSTISSILTQTVQDTEVLVVDDGSADTTPDVVRGIEDPRIRLISKTNGGVSSARNAGIEAARARWVAFLDSDDLWLPEKLELQLAAVENGGPRAVQSGVYYVDDELQVLSVERCNRTRDGLLNVLRFQNMPAAPSTLLAERDMLVRLGGFDESLVILEDWDLMIKLSRKGGVLSIEQPLALYRVHSGNRSRDVDLHVEPGLRVLDRLFADEELPEAVRAHRDEIYGRFYSMLAGAAFRTGRWRDWRRWTKRAISSDPRSLPRMASMPIRRLRRRVQRAAHRKQRLIHDG